MAAIGASVTDISQVSAVGDRRVRVGHRRLDRVGARRRVGADADEVDDAVDRAAVDEADARRLPDLEGACAGSPRRRPPPASGRDRRSTRSRRRSGRPGRPAPAPASMTPPIGALMVVLSASAWAEATAALAAATAASSAGSWFFGALPCSMSCLLASYSARRWSSSACACKSAAWRPSSEMWAITSLDLTVSPRATSSWTMTPAPRATALALMVGLGDARQHHLALMLLGRGDLNGDALNRHLALGSAGGRRGFAGHPPGPSARRRPKRSTRRRR